jgi:hypothetical protein
MAAKSLEERVQRTEDYIQIQNIMGRYCYYVMAGMQAEINDRLFAKNQPGSRVTWGTLGYWDGPDAPQRALGALRGMGGEERSRKGAMAVHVPLCPVVEVAGDGKTARGVWFSPGLLCMKDPKTGELSGMWEWDKYGVDFIKQDGQWKIWHHHIYSLLHWNIDLGWKKSFETPMPEMKRYESMDGGPYENNPYTPDTEQKLYPKPPDPYETFNPNERY